MTKDNPRDCPDCGLSTRGDVHWCKAKITPNRKLWIALDKLYTTAKALESYFDSAALNNEALGQNAQNILIAMSGAEKVLKDTSIHLADQLTQLPVQVSMHTGEPTANNEARYKGYARTSFRDDGDTFFPVCTTEFDGEIITHFAVWIGRVIIRVIPTGEGIAMTKGVTPIFKIYQEFEPKPDPRLKNIALRSDTRDIQSAVRSDDEAEYKHYPREELNRSYGEFGVKDSMRPGKLIAYLNSLMRNGKPTSIKRGEERYTAAVIKDEDMLWQEFMPEFKTAGEAIDRAVEIQQSGCTISIA